MAVLNRDFRSSDVLDPDWLPSYQEQITQLYLQACHLTNNLFLLERIVTFPFHLFPSKHRTFWQLVSMSLFESSLLCAWRIAIDNKGDFLTIRRFKNDVLKHIKCDAIKKEVQKRLKTLNFEKKLKKIQACITDYRHYRVAHYGPQQDIALPHVIVVAEACDAVIELIRFLGFEENYEFLVLEYNPAVKHPAGTETRPDIERLLDDCALSSRLMSMPEKAPVRWDHRRSRMTPKDIQLFNEYRAKFRLPVI
jgi:hypothetical protein